MVVYPVHGLTVYIELVLAVGRERNDSTRIDSLAYKIVIWIFHTSHERLVGRLLDEALLSRDGRNKAVPVVSVPLVTVMVHEELLGIDKE